MAGAPARLNRVAVFRTVPASAKTAPVKSNRQARGAAALLLSLTLFLPGCLVHEHQVGHGSSNIDQATMRQYYLFFGLVRLNEVNVQRELADKTSYVIDSGFRFWDFVLAPFLAPFTITTRTVRARW